MDYKSTWPSASRHPVPQWFRDAKFGEGVICAACLGVPGDELRINAPKRVSPEEIGAVSRLGVPGPLAWRHDPDEGLAVTTPTHVPSEHANCLRVAKKAAPVRTGAGSR